MTSVFPPHRDAPVRVAAVVVTYNRQRLLLECLDALRGQSRTADRIFVVDNCSTDGTAEALAAYARAHASISVIRLPVNVGGAGGFKAGLVAACAEDFDWIWLMDDDAEPRADCLSEMLRYRDLPDAAVIAPVVVRRDGALDERVPHRARFKTRWRSTFTSLARTVTREQLAHRSHVEIDHVSFVGPCIARWAVDRAGLPLGQFFIHFDDTEYSSRLIKHGKIHLIPAAVMLHKEEQLDSRPVRTVLGSPRPFVGYERLWLSYYGFRNMVWLIARGRVPVSRAMIPLRFAKLVLHALVVEDKKAARLRFWTWALVDGLSGHFDNARPRSLTSIDQDPKGGGARAGARFLPLPRLLRTKSAESKGPRRHASHR